MFYVVRKMLAPLVLVAMAVTVMAIFVLGEQTYRRQSWVAVNAKVVSIQQGCFVSYMAASGLLRDEGAIVPCGTEVGTLVLPAGASKPKIKRGLVGQIDYMAGDRQVTKIGNIGGVADGAKAGDSITVLYDPAAPDSIEYAGELKGLLGGFAIIGFGLAFCGTYIWLFWIRPFGKSRGPGLVRLSSESSSMRTTSPVQRVKSGSFGRRT